MSTQLEYTNLSDFLKASPFDAEYDLNGTLDPDVFWNELHVRSPRLDQLTSDLRARIDSGLEPNRVIFIKGYAGNGKTTFLHWFIRSFPDDQHVYIDVQRRTMTADDSSDEIKLLLNRQLRSMERFSETLTFVQVNRDALEDSGFISYNFYEYLSSAPEAANPSRLRRAIDRFELKDTFALFFIHLFLTRVSGRKTIVYFDNLDVARLEYLTDRFLLYFQDALSTALYVSRHELFSERDIRFRVDYRFIFCLREPNEAILNAHLADRVGFVRTPFLVSFDAEEYHRVAETRIRYVHDHKLEDLGPGGSARFITFLNAALRDRYMQDVFIPLYNHDYREIVGVLVSVLSSQAIVEREGRLDYEIRGNLMFGIVRGLIHTDFLQRYLRISPEPDHDGYCYIDRVMLTVLINRSAYRRGRPQEDSSEPQSLLYLVKDLNLVYRNIAMILDSIATCFLAYKQNRLHLVTVLNRRIDSKEFIPTYTELIERALGDDDSVETAKIRNELKSILVRVNPAGFTLVRYILPHFEFYSNLVKNTNALSHQPLERVSNPNSDVVYAFEEKIDKVFDQVQKHIASMKMFFDKRYLAEGITPARFARSCYCFRHPGTARVATSSGHSHTIKIITAHIDYIDAFRLNLLRSSGLEGDLLRSVNRSLVARIEKYVGLLNHALDVGAPTLFKEQFEHAIQTIAKDDYNDCKTRIEREVGRARSEP
jgi:hypothetical protein